MSRNRGNHWEQFAERWLRARGVTILKRNFQCRSGEIDLIARDGDEIAFVEVKYRARTRFGTGAEHVTWHKQRRIVSAARFYMRCYRHPSSQVFRFDVIAINEGQNGEEIEWIRGAFDAV